MLSIVRQPMADMKQPFIRRISEETILEHGRINYVPQCYKHAGQMEMRGFV